MEALGRGEALVKGQWGAAARAGAVSGPGADRHADSGDLDNPVPGPYRKVSDIVAGGNDRQESVANGLAALAASGWRGPVLVHDGVRPLASARVYDRVIEGTVSRGNAVAAIPLRDTIKRADGNRVVSQTLPREGLWQIQTPQGFWIDQLIDAYDEGKKRGLKVTDDASLLEALGYKVHLVDGDPINIKMTYKEDMEILKALLI